MDDTPRRGTSPEEELGRLAAVLEPVAEIVEHYDDALTVGYAGTVASLRVVAIGDGLDLVSLTQILAWDLPLTDDIYRRVAEQTAATLLGTVTLVPKPGSDDEADVMLRYNFPGAGLTDDALRTLVLMALDAGAEVRAALG
jgi:hypothetical protein